MMYAPSLTLAPAAKERLQFLLMQPGCDANTRLRIRLMSTGCAGFSYQFALSTQINNNDCCFTADEIPIVADETTARSLNNSRLDYENHLMGKQFRITTPAIAQFCSCGSSFAWKPRK